MAARSKGLIAGALVVTACAAGAMRCAGGAGEDAPGPSAPAAARIVSVVPALTEVLFALGAGPAVVGVSSYDHFPAEATRLPRVGALLNPDTERILSLQPDMVVIYGSQSDLRAQLARGGIRTYEYRHGGLDSVLGTITDLAGEIGRPEEGARLVDAIRADLADVAARVQGRGRPRTLLVLERDPGSLRGLHVSGGRGFLHDMLETAGGTNVFEDVDREAVQPSIETLLSRAPEVIIEVRGSGFDALDVDREHAAWRAMSSVPAVERGRIHFLSGDHLVVPGPRVVQGTRALAAVLHPAAAE